MKKNEELLQKTTWMNLTEKWRKRVPRVWAIAYIRQNPQNRKCII